MSRRLAFITFPIILLFGLYFVGPAPEKPKWNPEMPTVPQDADGLEKYIATQESKHKIKPDNHARILWNDSTSKSRTPYSVVYLHGFSASQEEGDPVHETFARTFGCNLYLSRLADHGIDTTEQLLYFTADRLWESAKEALAIGKALGDKVILMSTSTGGSMALALAAQYPDDVHAMINLSPNIALKHPAAFISNNAWGLQLSRIVQGGKYFTPPFDPGVDTAADLQYWNKKYRLEAVTQLQELLESKMTRATFEKIKQPSLTLYYYKSEEDQDTQVKVSAILEMNEQLGTPDSLKVIVPVPNGGGHVLGSHIVSKDIATVIKETREFGIQKLKMKVVNESQ